MALAQSLGGGKERHQPETPPPPEYGDEPPRTDPEPAAAPDLSALLGSLTGEGGGLDPCLLTLGARIMSEYNSDDGGRTALAPSAAPLCKGTALCQLDRAIQIAKLSRLIRWP